MYRSPMHNLGALCTLWLVAACGGSKPPATPAPVSPTTDEHADVVAFCSAEAAQHAAGGLADLGPYLEPKLNDTQMKKIVMGMKDGTTGIADAKVQVDALVAAEQVTACPTRDTLFAPKP